MTPVVPIAALVIVVGAVLLMATNAQGQSYDTEEIVNTQGTYSTAIQNFAQAISFAEGFGVAGAIPTLANNPGDMIVPAATGATGKTLGSEGITVFDSVQNGWNALYHQLQLIVNGSSHVYSLSDTIDSMAAKWTNTQASAWSANVASYLGVPSSTSLSSLLS